MRKKFIPILVIFFISIFFFRSLLSGLLPIPADTIVGLYHPFRDYYARNYPRGIPFKNFLITDSVRQQYPWRSLAIDLFSRYEIPLWNPYSFAGTPLLANFQSAVLYPLNIIFFIIPTPYAWSLLVFMQPVLAGIFLYLYLINLRLNSWASLLAAIAFSFSGFSMAWLEWNTIGHTALWLPLVLLSIDKLFYFFSRTESSKIKIQISKLQLKAKKYLIWGFIYQFALVASFLAGHLQTFFYLYVVQLIYFIFRWLQFGRLIKILGLFLLLNTLFILLTLVQWYPTLQFISLSARSVDINWQQEGWFIPWQHLIQFIVPDFFGNPTTLNYWGVWNYGEFIGYIGVFPLVMAIYALFFRYDRKTFFFGLLFFLSLLFSLPTSIAKLPFLFHIPFLSTAQPTRIMFVTDFSLAVLAGLGFDYYLRMKDKVFYVLIFIGATFAFLWYFLLWVGSKYFHIVTENISVAQRNTYLPLLIFICITAILLLKRLIPKRFVQLPVILLFVITIFDLLRFAYKFTPFTNSSYLFPSTHALSFLQKQIEDFRIMTTDSRILPPNFSMMYKLQSVDGYDPLYLHRYGELIAGSERGQPNINPPFGYNRIITPHNVDSPLIDLLGVKYVLSLTDLTSPKLKKVFQEGQTRVYENMNTLPRVFFVTKTYYASGKQQAIERLFHPSFDISKEGVVEYMQDPGERNHEKEWVTGEAKIVEYSEDKVIIETIIDTSSKGEEGFLILTDSFYPTWRVKISNGNTGLTYEEEIFRTDFNFRGVVVPQGFQRIEFFNTIVKI